MRNRLLTVLLCLGVTTLTWSLIRGQEPTLVPGTLSPPRDTTIPLLGQTPTTPLTPPRDLSRLTGLAGQMAHTAQGGADWLFRMHGLKGQFRPGLLPALNKVMEGDSFLRQAGATVALGRAARVCGEERYAARATQAVLALLDETALDGSDSLTRNVTVPPAVVNRLGATAALVLAIHALPAPQQDLLDRSDQLCRSLRNMVREDGALGWVDGSGKLASTDDGIPHFPGLAIQALLASQRHRPADWKLDVARKALPIYRAWWKTHHDLDFVATMAPAFAEAYLLTKEKAFADFVFEMNDWLCPLQYMQIDPRQSLWYGGFRDVQAGRAVDSQPTAKSAACASALVAGCRVASEKGDLTHHQRYNETLERTLQFLGTLQYTDGVTQHFASWYRPQVQGAFHTSHTDGNLRIDDTQQAVAALLGYLEHVVR